MFESFPFMKLAQLAQPNLTMPSGIAKRGHPTLQNLRNPKSFHLQFSQYPSLKKATFCVAAEIGDSMMEEGRTRKRQRTGWDVELGESRNLRTRRADYTQAEEVRSRKGSPPRRDDDRDGHYVFNLGENLTPRYKILGKMGEGTFGRVLECWDRQEHAYVAIKIVRSVRKYRDAAKTEVDVLQLLAKNDRGNTHCVRMLDWFDYRNHICIVFEKLGPSLFDFLKRNKYMPFPVDLVREFGRQLLESVSYMHDIQLVHTDLKPENILLESSDQIKVPSSRRVSSDRYLPKSSAIKLIDFGSTVYDNKIHSSIVSTRHYRAPEIILGLGWTYPCDLWSIGCILVELCTGEMLFQTHENLEHLAMMEKVLGPLPQHMIKRASKNTENFFKNSHLNWPGGATSRESIRAVKKLDRLKDLISFHVESSTVASSLIDLLQGLLKYDPTERITAHEALEHPFFEYRI